MLAAPSPAVMQPIGAEATELDDDALDDALAEHLGDLAKLSHERLELRGRELLRSV